MFGNIGSGSCYKIYPVLYGVVISIYCICTIIIEFACSRDSKVIRPNIFRICLPFSYRSGDRHTTYFNKRCTPALQFCKPCAPFVFTLYYYLLIFMLVDYISKSAIPSILFSCRKASIVKLKKNEPYESINDTSSAGLLQESGPGRRIHLRKHIVIRLR